jgi:putative membrane protein
MVLFKVKKITKGDEKMFIDYVTIQLIAAASGLLFAGIYAIKFEAPIQYRKSWIYAFWMVGAILFITGLNTIFTWPLPGAYNIIFGEPSVWFGALLIFLGFSIRSDSDLMPMALISMAGGLINLVIAGDVLIYNMTQSPALAFVGFLTSGLGALLIPFGLKSKTLRWIIAIFLIIAAVIFAITGFGAYYQHAGDFAHWVPSTMKK